MKLSPSLENRLTARAKNVILAAENIASEGEIGGSHLIKAILEARGSLAYNILRNHGLSIDDFPPKADQPQAENFSLPNPTPF